jgi:DNA-binding NtrC family response regulator
MIELNLPPLRDRKEDLAALCTYLLERCRGRFATSVRHVSAEAMAMLEMYDWPGNVRELENALGRGSVLAADDTLRPADLPPEVQGHLEITGGVTEEGTFALQPAILRVKRHFMAEALRAANGNKREAARLLGISRRGLYNLLEEIDR